MKPGPIALWLSRLAVAALDALCELVSARFEEDA